MLSYCRVAVCVLCLVLTVSVEFPGNTYLFAYTDRHADRRRQTDGKTDRQTDRQVNKLKDFFWGGGRWCGFGVDDIRNAFKQTER